jgi:AcrR family transcriptional regulator
MSDNSTFDKLCEIDGPMTVERFIELNWFGQKTGRGKGIDTADVVGMKQSGMSVQEIADKLRVTVAAIHYHLKKKEDKPQLVTYEHHRDRRLKLETDLAGMRRRQAAEELVLQEEISRVKQTEDRLFEQRQLQIGYGSDGAVILKKNGRELDLSQEDIKRLLAKVRVAA